MICPHCGKTIDKKAGVKVFEGFMSQLFVLAVQKSRNRTVAYKYKIDDKTSETRQGFFTDIVTSEDFRKAGFTTRYVRLGDLKYWGLLVQRPEFWHQGIYQVTILAKRFLIGLESVSREVTVSGGIVVGQGEDRIGLKTAFKGEWNTISDWIQEWRKTQHIEDFKGSTQLSLL